MRRRRFLGHGLIALGVLAAGGPAEAREVVWDRQTHLDRAAPSHIVRPRSVDEVRAAVRLGGPPVCPAGRLHSSGGQGLLEGGCMLDMTALDAVRSVDVERGIVAVEAGAQWPVVVSYLRAHAAAWTIRQKQTVATVTLGGSVSANAHGNRLGSGPMAGDVEWLEVVDAAGAVGRCSRDSDVTRFRAALGGFGLVGVVTALGLRLQKRVALRSLVDVVRVEEVAEAFDRRAREGAAYATCVLPCDLASPDYLRRGFLLYDTPDAAGTVEKLPSGFSPRAWVAQMRRLHRAPADAWAAMCAAWLDAAGHTWWGDDLLMQGTYVDGYHRLLDGGRGTDVMVEFLLPPPRFAAFVAALRQRLRGAGLQALLCEIRRVGRDVDSLLCYTPEPRIALVVAVHVDRSGARAARDTLGRAVDDALALGGGFHPAFSWCATPARLRAAMRGLDDFLAVKRAVDPRGRFSSEWARRLL